jgi:hypothetical protein
MIIKFSLALFIIITSLFSSENVIIGVLAFRSKAETLKEWQPTARYLQYKPKFKSEVQFFENLLK